MSNSDWGYWEQLINVSRDQLVAMARQREIDYGLLPAADDHRSVINMLRHEYTNYDSHVRNAKTDRLYVEILDAIAHDFPWLASQCAVDKATHPDRLPPWAQTKRYAHADSQTRQRAAREVMRQINEGGTVLVKWRSQWRTAEVIEKRRTRLKLRLRLDDGDQCVIDRAADEVRLPNS